MKVQRQSRSLLALYGSVADQSPSFSPDHIQATIDVSWMLSQGRQVVQTNNNAAAAVGAGAAVIVPAGEYWMLIAHELFIAGQAGMTYVSAALTLSIDSNAASGVAWREFTGAALAVPTNGFRIHHLPQHHLLLGPGSFVSSRVDGLTGVANVNITLAAMFFRLPA